MEVYQHISLRHYHTFGIEASARCLMVIGEDDVLPRMERPFLVVGEGSDIVFTRDYQGTVLRLADSGMPRLEGSLVTAWGGMKMDALVQWTLEHGLYGLENLSAIPGTVGAAAVQNVGAYGVEASDSICRVDTVDLLSGDRHSYTNSECRFGYRTSRFKQGDGSELVTYVTFRLNDRFTPILTYKALAGQPHENAWQLREAITAMRWQKLPRPEEHGSAGSFFKNPVVSEAVYRHLRESYPDMPEAHPADGNYKLSAGWLIDRAGWKGRTQGGAGVWPANALVLYNAGGCTGDDVVALAEAIQRDVQRQFGIGLVPEAIIV